MSDTFLTREEVRELTGRTHKSLQIAALAKMGLPFFVNPVGQAVVARVAVLGRNGPAPKVAKQWVPNVLKTG